MLARKALAGTAGAPKVYVEDVFSTYLYTGNGSTQTITNNIDLSTKGGLVWTKSRGSSTLGNELTDTVRGAGLRLISNTTAAQGGANSSDTTGFTSSGFELTYNNGLGNLTDQNYVSWTFRKAEKFFDVVTFTTNASGGATVSHALGSTPGCVIIKSTGISQNWFVYHRGLTTPNDYMINLNTTAAEQNQGAAVWSASSSAFTINNGTLSNSTAYVAYLFAHDAGGFGDAGSDNVISCGSFTTNGSGVASVSLGYEPQWVLVKRTDSTSDWFMIDNMRGWTAEPNNPVAMLRANLSSAENTASFTGWSINATGFGWSAGAASATYIYIAIRRGPMKTPTTGTSVFTPVAYTGNGTARTTVTDIVTDLSIIKKRNTSYNPSFEDRLRGANQVLESNTTAGDIATTQYILGFDVQNGVRIGTDVGVNESSSTFINWAFRRAPGFFDVVCYTGTGSNTTISHNLGVVPEMMIVKHRNGPDDWAVYHSALGNTKYLWLNSTNAEATSQFYWNNTTPTTSVFTLGTQGRVNDSGGTYVAYLFASVSGVSKVGSYTGNGSSVTVTTGFQPRFIMVKRTDSTGNWIVSDSARGLVSGSDPYLLLNSTAAEDTDEDWVDVSSTGFTVNETSAANANVNTGTYIYLAVS